ncbi:MAG TPA: hypothetical protein VK771_01650 [Acidimicrobiia bacterium]|nr:hypothetical protein [Acidimicrobiia bacterium]
MLVREPARQLPTWRDLAPTITRQRLIVEGTAVVDFTAGYFDTDRVAARSL